MRILIRSILSGVLFLAALAPVAAQGTNSPSYTASPSAEPIPTGLVEFCQSVQVSGQGSTVPGQVTFQVNPTIIGWFID